MGAVLFKGTAAAARRAVGRRVLRSPSAAARLFREAILRAAMSETVSVRIACGRGVSLPRDDLRSWYESGLVAGDTQVQKAGSRDWTSLSRALDISQWKKPAAARGVSVPAGRTPGRSGAAASREPAPAPRTGPRPHTPPLPLL